MANVADAYIGVWRRLLLRTPTVEDTTTEVYWLQTRDWHADIRVPKNRPACKGKSSLQQLDRIELLGLAQQQGFAGITEVKGNICRWHRRVDFQPPSGFNDVGRMVFESPDRVLEYGVEQAYFEIWERLPDSTENPSVNIQITDKKINEKSTPSTIEVNSGKYFIFVRPRQFNVSTAAIPENAEALRTWVDFEISFGSRATDGSKQILRSTLPWREGQRIFENAD
jgi:hypothetical protein